ncbi:hypothetical protein MRX96_057159 [Rhipicephalus microplus]
MDNFSIKRPELFAELPGNSLGLCDEADDHPTHHGGTSAHSMNTLGVISAATADTTRSASSSTPNEGKALESASKNGGATTGKPSIDGRLRGIRPEPTNGNGGRGFENIWQSTYNWLSYNAQTRHLRTCY